MHSLGSGLPRPKAIHRRTPPTATVFTVGGQSYSYRKSIPITGQSGAGTNYQRPVVVYAGSGTDAAGVVYLNSKAQHFPDDVTFTASDGTTVLDFWYELATDTFWVEVAANLDSDTTIYIYYGSAISVDPIYFPSGEFVRYGSAVLSPTPATWDASWVNFTSIVKSGDTYYGYYEGSNDAAASFRGGLATSSDGITWAKHGSNPILNVGSGGAWDDYSVIPEEVWIEGATWYMLYAGRQSGGPWKMGLATSSDGVTWTKSGSNPVMSPTASTWDSAWVDPGSVIKIGSTYYCYYSGGTSIADLTTWAIGLATSTDLTTWTKSGNNPLLSGVPATWEKGVSHPMVRAFGSTYAMFYYAQEITPNNTRIGLATSSALDSGWTRDASNPIIGLGDEAQGDDWWVEVPTLIQVGLDWRLYYLGNNQEAGSPQAFYATYKSLGSGANMARFFSGLFSAAGMTNPGGFVFEGGRAKLTGGDQAVHSMFSADQYSHAIAIRARAKLGADWTAGQGKSWSPVVLWDDAWATSGYLAGHYNLFGSIFWRLAKYPGGTTNDTNEDLTGDTWYTIDLLIDGSNQTLLVDGVQKGALTTSPPQASAKVQLAAIAYGFTVYFDHVFARKYISPEPVVGTPGAEETP